MRRLLQCLGVLIVKFFAMKKGETLIEVIISLGVLMITLGYSGTLIASTTAQMGLNRDHIIASNLAKEGIEIMRNMIGTNLFRLKSDIENCWNAGFKADGSQITDVEDCENNLFGGGGAPNINNWYIFSLSFNPLNLQLQLDEKAALSENTSARENPLAKDSISFDFIDCLDLDIIPCILGPTNTALRNFGVSLDDSSGLYRTTVVDDPDPKFFRIIEIQYINNNVMEVISHVFFQHSGEFREIRFATLITPFEI